MSFRRPEVASYKGRRSSVWLRRIAALFLAGCLVFAGLLAGVVSGAHDVLRGQPQIMVILGCQVKPWGPSILLQDRLDTALAYLEEHPGMTVVVSGGQGPDEPESEAQCMADYLVQHGVAREQILLEDRSHNTLENLLYTQQLLTEHEIDLNEDAVLVSNGFHLTRARMLWGRVWDGEGELSTLAAPSSHGPSKVKMYIREPLALGKSLLVDWG